MTNGASQGLFVIVAVVIFGIFVLISYMLFRNKLQTGLADIFDDRISQTTDDLTIWTNLSNLNLFKSTVISKTDSEYKLKLNPSESIFYWGNDTPIGLQVPKIAVKSGENIKLSFEITSDKNSQAVVDFNLSNKENEVSNDFYSNPTISSGIIKSKSVALIEIKKNETKKISYTLTNSTENTLFDTSNFGIIKSDTTDNIFTIANIKYTIITNK